MHVKFDFIQKSYVFIKNADSAGNRNIMKFHHVFKVDQIPEFTKFTGTIIWNMHMKFASIPRS